MKTLTEVKANATRAEIALTAGHQILRSLGSAFRIRHFGRPGWPPRVVNGHHARRSDSGSRIEATRVMWLNRGPRSTSRTTVPERRRKTPTFGASPSRRHSACPVTWRCGTFRRQWVFFSGDHGAWGWIVSPRANISTNWPMRLERVSGFLAFPIL
jgi:hypothetical protein